MGSVDESELLEYLEKNYLPQARWWPWKGSWRRVQAVDKIIAEDLAAFLLEAEGLVFHLPLARVSGIPDHLNTRGFCIKGECFVEAEYLPGYLSLIVEAGWAEIEYMRSSLKPNWITDARPLTLESTNAVCQYTTREGERLVVKSYRLIPVVNIEELMLRKLSSEGYKHAPEVQAFVKHRDVVTGVVSKYIEGVGDGGYPFYNALLEYLRGSSSVRTGLAAKLGVVISGLHEALNRDGKGFFGVEPVTSSDIELWSHRVERMLSESLRRLDELTSSEAGPPGLDYWRSMLDKSSSIVDSALSALSEYQGLLKARIHQDLHLAQMIYVESPSEDFVITDFEGEPGRRIEERTIKEPVLRDIASMVRSFHYLSHAALMQYSGRSVDDVSRLMITSDPSAPWRYTHVKAMVYSYLADVDSARLVGVSKSSLLKDFRRLLYPWIVERAVYEVFYESLYRPGWVSIPIAGLMEAERYLNEVVL